MVQLLVDALGGDVRVDPSRPQTGTRRALSSPIECYHLDARYSADIDDVGQARFNKVFLAFKYSLQAIWWRFRHGVRHLYYIPAFPARTPIYRDWLVLGLCRPFFKFTIYHWHAVGLGDWIQSEARPWERWLSNLIFSKPDLSVVLRPFNRSDAEQLKSKRIEVVPNGVPDPCPDFDSTVLPGRSARVQARQNLIRGKEPLTNPPATTVGDASVFQLLYVSLCYSGKGLFDTIEATALVNQKLQGSPMKIRLTVAGKFWLEEEKIQFEKRVRQPDLQNEGQPVVDYRGFVGGADKRRLFLESDCLCFPTRMPESFGLVLVEGMAYGLPLITTDWRNIPELLPPHTPGIVPPKSPKQIANAIIEAMSADRQFCKKSSTTAATNSTASSSVR